MKAVLTGATGFLGRHVVRTLQTHSVMALVRSHSRVELITDFISPDRLIPLDHHLGARLREIRPDVVVHMATCYGREGQTRRDVFETNLAMPKRLLGAAEAAEVPLFVNIDTSLPAQISPYAKSKRYFSAWCERAAQTSSIRIANIKVESIYGPHDDDWKFVTQLIRALIRNDDEFALTPGAQHRDFIHVDDASAALALLVKTLLNESDRRWVAAEIGTGVMTSVRELAETAKRIAGAKTALAFGMLPYREHELMETRADITELKRFGWPGARSLEHGLTEVIEVERRKL